MIVDALAATDAPRAVCGCHAKTHRQPFVASDSNTHHQNIDHVNETSTYRR